MKVLSTNIYVGPNIYANFPVIRQVIDIGILENWPSVKIGKQFIDGLLEKIPSLKEHGCSYREPGGFVRRLTENEGTWMGHIWEHVVLELQNIAGSNVSFGKTRSTKTTGQYNMIYEYKQSDVGVKASELAQNLLLSLLPKELQDSLGLALNGFDFENEKVNFIRFAQDKEFGPSTASLVNAAKKINIPYIRLDDHSLVQFGYGKYQKRIRATITSETKHIAVELSCDKEATNQLLESLGSPVPKQITVRSPEDAVLAAHKLGYPVVVKPLDGNHGRGISINLTKDDQVRIGYEYAREHARTIIVERYITGEDHRMLVINGKLVAVAKRIPGHVVGDGKHNIKELVDLVNQDPRRGVGHEKSLTNLLIDTQAETLMEKSGFTVETVLPKGEIFYLRSTANLSTGGTAIDMTDVVHPDNRDMAERAVRAIGLDVGGVDFITPDITSSYHDVGGAIVEVNAAPGFRMHVAPSEGKPRDVAKCVMDMLFPEPEKAHVPIVSITGTNGKTTTSRMVAHMWKNAGKQVGLTTTDGIYINGRLTVSGDTTGPKSAKVVLKDPTVEVAVFETARGGLLRSGMGYAYCDVGACINVTRDHMGLRGVDTLNDLARVKRVVIESAKHTAVLNADDTYCLKMAGYTKASNIFYVTMNPEHDLVREHIRSGGKAITLESGINGAMITVFDNNVHIPILWTHLIPATLEGKAVHNVQNAMFAIAICYSMGMQLDDIRSGLMTFTTNYFQTPGRLNVFEEHPFKVILDYAHNIAAMEMLGELVTRMEVQGERICVIASPGDRQNEDIIEFARTAGKYFDKFICREDDELRGRKSGEVPELIKQGLLKAKVDPNKIITVLSEVESIEYGLTIAKPHDLLVILADDVKRCWKQITKFNSENKTVDKKIETKKHQITIKPTLSKEISALLSAGVVIDERGARVVSTDEEISD